MGLSGAFRILLRPIAWSLASAVVLVTIIYLIGNGLGASMEVTIQGDVVALGVWDMIWVSAITVGIGGVVAVVLLAWVPKPGWVFGVLAMLTFALFLVPPFTATDDGGTTITLIMAHVAKLAPVLILVVPTMLAPPADVSATA